MTYLGEFLVVSEGVLEVEVGLLAPVEGVAVAALSRPHVVVPARAVADVVHELVGATLVVLEGVLPVLGVREGEVALTGRLELRQLVDLVLG